LENLKEKRGGWKLKEEELDRSVWELAVEKALDLSYDRLRNERMVADMIMMKNYADFQ
jgi:hypothetical protein